ncbi:MAG: hypothetical protein RL491_386, partial [Bacteroidota bacterium]
METFIDEIAKEIIAEGWSDPSKVCIVFPTRRACLIFRNRFGHHSGKPVWAPKVMSIGDFVSTNSGFPVSEEMELLTALYDVYKSHWPKHDFGKFYPWGRMLLGDFDEADKQVEDPILMFRNISELKKIDATFLPDAESLKFLTGFLKTLDVENLTKLQKEFAENWNNLRSIYEGFQVELDKRNLSYEGRSYRQFISNIKNGLFKPDYDSLIFAGFHGFSLIEEKMIAELGKLSKTKIHWDTDDLYVKDPLHEAGAYFRESEIVKSHPVKTSNRITAQNKSLDIISVPLIAGQAKLTGQILQDIFKEAPESINKTAVVLPDEKTLLPVLFAIPGAIESLNVTMGFPLKQSQFASLIVTLKKLAESSVKNTSGDWVFDRRLVKQTIAHPLIASSFSIQKSDPDIHEWRLTQEQIANLFGFADSQSVFQGAEDSSSVFQHVSSLLLLIAEKGTNRPNFENDILLFMAAEIQKASTLLANHLNEIRKETAWTIIRDIINALRIPFSGEPVQGLQVMGFLETRGLDFENIILLNVNESILPADGQQHSFIPFALRKAFGLSTYLERESSYAYHFYRLLHRSKRVFLVYNSEAGVTGGGEPSRYIQQIIREVGPSASATIKINHRSVAAPLEAPTYPTLSIVKDPSVMETLKYFSKGGESEKRGALSSTAISTYINCPMQFYYKYVAGLREEQEESEKIDAAGFGNILHKVMELLYTPFHGANVTSSDINDMLLRSNQVVEDVVDAEFSTKYNQLQGTDVLTGEVIKTMVVKILKEDLKSSPFHFVQSEGRFNTTIDIGGMEIKLTGIFDRLDQVNDSYRIIDYKTGNVELSCSGIIELFLSPKKKTLFQLHFYKLLYESVHPDRTARAGFYAVRQMKEGVSF